MVCNFLRSIRLEPNRFRSIVRNLLQFISIRQFPAGERGLPAPTRSRWWIPTAVRVLALLSMWEVIFYTPFFPLHSSWSRETQWQSKSSSAFKRTSAFKLTARKFNNGIKCSPKYSKKKGGTSFIPYWISYCIRLEIVDRPYTIWYRSHYHKRTCSCADASNNTVNSSPPLVLYTEFYNSTLDHIDLMKEYLTWQQPERPGQFSFCQYPFILSIAAKRFILTKVNIILFHFASSSISLLLNW